MELKSFSNMIQKLCQLSTNYTGFRFQVVDANLNWIGSSNLDEYCTDDHGISSDSMIAQTIQGQRPLVFDRRRTKRCLNCENRMSCRVEDLIGVPIICGDEVIGAVILDAPMNQINEYFHGIQHAIDYLALHASMISDVYACTATIETSAAESSVQGIARSMDHDLFWAVTDATGRILSRSSGFYRFFPTFTYQEALMITDFITLPPAKRLNSFPFFLFSSIEHNEFWGSISVLPYQGVSLPEAKRVYVFRNLRNSAYSFEHSRFNVDILPFSLNASPYKSVLIRASYFAESRMPVLICGQEANGKNQIARWIHENSLRKNDYFVDIDCSEIPVFDQVVTVLGLPYYNRPDGLLWKANKGTAYFKNIEYLSIALQKKLVGLFSGVISPNTFNIFGRLDIHFLFSSSKDLATLLKLGYLDREFYEILSGNEIQIPEINVNHPSFSYLVDAVAEEYAIKNSSSVVAISDELKIALQNTPRLSMLDLQRIIEQAIREATLKKAELNKIANISAILSTQDQEQKSNRLNLIRQMMKNRVSKAQIINTLGISRATFYRDLKRIQEEDNS